jgi:hypothetical protein
MTNVNKSKKYHFIYKTTNLLNGKYYIGMHSTSNLKDGYLGSGKKLRYSIRKYGKENFKLEILEFLESRDELVKRERELVNEDILKDSMCMNLKIGGTGGWGFKNKEIKTKLIKLLKEYSKINWSNPEYKERMRIIAKKVMDENHKLGKCKYDNFRGKKHKDDSKKKIGLANSIKQKGINNSQFGTSWITNGIENKKIRKNDLIPNGWQIGRIINNKNTLPIDTTSA